MRNVRSEGLRLWPSRRNGNKSLCIQIFTPSPLCQRGDGRLNEFNLGQLERGDLIHVDKFQKRVHRLNFYVSVVGMALLIPLMLLTTGDVVGRSFFRKPIPGSFELSEFILAVFILLGAAYTQQVKGHVGVDFVTSRLSIRARVSVRSSLPS